MRLTHCNISLQIDSRNTVSIIKKFIRMMLKLIGITIIKNESDSSVSTTMQHTDNNPGNALLMSFVK